MSAVKLRSGRAIEVLALKPITGSRSANARVAMVGEWLRRTALDDANAVGNECVAGLVRGMKEGGLTPADLDILNDYLFGSARGINLMTGQIQ